MTSGKKKRKAKKKKMGTQLPDPDSSTTIPQDNGEAHHHHDGPVVQEEEQDGRNLKLSLEEEGRKGDRSGFIAVESVDVSMLSSENGGSEVLRDSDEVSDFEPEQEKLSVDLVAMEEEESPMSNAPLAPDPELDSVNDKVSESEAPVSIESIVTESDLSDTAADWEMESSNPQAALIVDLVSSEEKEVPPASEVPMVPSVEIVSIHIHEEVAQAVEYALTETEAPLSATGSKTPEIAETSSFAASHPPSSDRATWRNCCGLLDVLSGSQR